MKKKEGLIDTYGIALIEFKFVNGPTLVTFQMRALTV